MTGQKTDMNNGNHDAERNEDVDDPMQRMIGEQLKHLYNEVLTEPIPPRLVHLLEQLDQVTADKSSKGS